MEFVDLEKLSAGQEREQVYFALRNRKGFMSIFQTLRGTGEEFVNFAKISEGQERDYVCFAKCEEKEKIIHVCPFCLTFLRAEDGLCPSILQNREARVGVNPFCKMHSLTEEGIHKNT